MTALAELPSEACDAALTPGRPGAMSPLQVIIPGNAREAAQPLASPEPRPLTPPGVC